MISRALVGLCSPVIGVTCGEGAKNYALGQCCRLFRIGSGWLADGTRHQNDRITGRIQ